MSVLDYHIEYFTYKYITSLSFSSTSGISLLFFFLVLDSILVTDSSVFDAQCSILNAVLSDAYLLHDFGLFLSPTN